MTACGSTCVPKKATSRVRLFALDTCGRMVTAGTSNVLDWDGFETIGWSNQIEEGETETITNTDGETCYDDQSCPVDKGQKLMFTECTENDSFMAMTGHGTLSVNLEGDVDGIDRTALNCNAKLALEVIFKLPSACDAAGVPLCVVRLYPEIGLFINTSEQTVNGKNVLRNTYSAKARRGNGRLFEGFLVPGTPTGEMAHWNTWKTVIAAGGAYYHQRCIPCPTFADPRSCELRALDIVT